MTKTDLINEVYSNAEGKLTKAEAERVVNKILSAFTTALASGDSIAFVGFGTLKPAKRAARQGRNPRTGEAIEIAASTTVKFTPGKELKDALK